VCALAQDFSRSRISQRATSLKLKTLEKTVFFAVRVANLVDFSPIKANLGSLLKNVFGIFKTNIWTFKVF
jgi:hypothetical protein